MSENETYQKLIDWLVTTFRAQPGVRTAEFEEIVRASYTVEEAKLAIEMGPDGGTLDELVSKTSRTKEELTSMLESMLAKGTLWKHPRGDDPVYRPLVVEIPGLVEGQLWRESHTPYGRKLLELWSKFKTIYVHEGILALGRHSVAQCAATALPPDAKPEENVLELLKNSNYHAVSECPCRKMDYVKGEVCACGELEFCLSLGDVGRWAVQNNFAREITLEEATGIALKAEKIGCVHTGTANLVLCNCCKHSCINLVGQKAGLGHSYLQNHFYAVVDQKTCNSCGVCEDRCHVGAIKVEKNGVVANKGECIGCGSCVTGCELKAVKMIRRSEDEVAAVDQLLVDGFTRILSKVSRIDPQVTNPT